jgi:predicted nucleic acid-binding Zn ribbon protein
MPQTAKAEFVKGTRVGATLEQMRRGPVGPPSWAKLRGVRDRDLTPGHPYFCSARLTMRPGRNATRAEVEVFLVEFLELGAARIPQAALEPKVRELCLMLGWRKLVGKARFIARDIQPKATKKRGATSVQERRTIDAWIVSMKEKCGRLKDELDSGV